MMQFTITAADASYNSLESLYTAPIRAISRKVKVAALAFLLFVGSMDAGAIESKTYVESDGKVQTEISDLPSSLVSESQFSDLEVVLKQNDLKVFARMLTAFQQRKESLNILCKSFVENFDDGQTDIERFAPLFKTMSAQLCQLKIVDAFVDVSRKKDLIDFNLNLKNGYFLSVAKTLSETDNNVMFAIAKEQQTLAVDEMPLADLIREIKELVA